MGQTWHSPSQSCLSSPAPLLWDGLGHGGEPGPGQDGDGSWEMTAGTDLGCAGARAPPALIRHWLCPPQPCGRAGAAPLSPHLLGPQGGLERSGAVPGLSHQGDLGAVHPSQLTEHGQEQEEEEVLQRWALARAVPLALEMAGGRPPPSEPRPLSHGRGLEGTRCDRRNRASISEHKDSHHLHFNSPVPPTAVRMLGRPPTRTEHLPPGSQCVGSGQGQGLHPGAAAGNALLDPMAVSSPREPSTAFLQTQLPLRES